MCALPWRAHCTGRCAVSRTTERDRSDDSAAQGPERHGDGADAPADDGARHAATACAEPGKTRMPRAFTMRNRRHRGLGGIVFLAFDELERIREHFKERHRPCKFVLLCV